MHYIIHELLKLCTPEKFLRIGPVGSVTDVVDSLHVYDVPAAGVLPYTATTAKTTSASVTTTCYRRRRPISGR